MPVSFEEEQKLMNETAGAQSQHFLGLSGWLVRKGLAANQTSADLTLVVLAGVIIVASFFIYKAMNRVGLPSPEMGVVERILTLPPNEGHAIPPTYGN